MTKFKVGDKVRIRKDLQYDAVYNEFRANSHMVSMRGQKKVIKEVLDECYILESGLGYAWTDDMLEPVEEKTYPRVMLVSNDNKEWHPRVVFMEKCNTYVAWINAETLKEAESETTAYGWEYAKEPEEKEEEVVEMTMEEVCKALGKTVKIIK